MAFDLAKIKSLPDTLLAKIKAPGAKKPATSVAEEGVTVKLPMLVVVLFILLAGAAQMGVRQLRSDADFAAGVGDVQVFVQQMTRDVLLAAQGDTYAASRTKAAAARVAQGIDAIKAATGGVSSMMGGISAEQLEKLNADWAKLQAQSRPILAKKSASVDESEKLAALGDDILAVSRDMVKQYVIGNQATIWFGIAFAAGLLALIMILVNGNRQAAAARANTSEIEAANLRNQEAILHLLDREHYRRDRRLHQLHHR